MNIKVEVGQIWECKKTGRKAIITKINSEKAFCSAKEYNGLTLKYSTIWLIFGYLCNNGTNFPWNHWDLIGVDTLECYQDCCR